MYIAMENVGKFDVVGAINMLGASVKVNENPIGMFGSGTKFALAQLARMGINTFIYNGEELLETKQGKKTFRERQFNIVKIKNHTTGKLIDTPITSDFGGKDWNDPWFIFRELWSNMLDEYGHAYLTENIVEKPGHTIVYLPYESFKEYYDNIETYFKKDKCQSVQRGTGRIFKHGVYVGSIDAKLDFSLPRVEINECRVMKNESAFERIVTAFTLMELDIDTWAALFESGPDFWEKLPNMQIGHYSDNARQALIRVFGENYCICPAEEDIIKDVQAMQYVPVVFPASWGYSKLTNVKSLLRDKAYRPMNEDETEKYNRARKKLSAFIPVEYEPKIEVIITDKISLLGGNANMLENRIGIVDTMFNNEHELMHTVLHEFGHIITKAGDYDRRFTAWFVNALVNIAK